MGNNKIISVISNKPHRSSRMTIAIEDGYQIVAANWDTPFQYLQKYTLNRNIIKQKSWGVHIFK